MNIIYPEEHIEAEENELDTRITWKFSTPITQSSSITIAPATAISHTETFPKSHYQCLEWC